MVTDAAIEEAVEQAEDDAPQVDVLAPEEPETASAVDSADDVDADASDAVIEAETEADEPPPSLDDLLASNPAYQEELAERLKVERNAGAQQREATLRKELGNDANAKARLEGYAKYVEENGSDPARLNVILQDRDLHTTDAALRHFGRQALEHVGQTATQIERSIAKLESASGDALTAFVGEIWADSTEAIREAAKADAGNLSFDDIPKDSKLYGEFMAAKASAVAAELKAQGITARGSKEPAPLVPSGGAVEPGGDDPILIKLEEQGKSALTADELKYVTQLLGVRAS